MWRNKLCFAVCFISLYIVAVGTEKACDPHSLQFCGENMSCFAKSNIEGECRCKKGFKLENDRCISMPSTERSFVNTTSSMKDQKTNSGGASVAAGLLIPTFLILFAAAAYYGARRYKWLQRFRQFRQNRYGNVLVTRDETDDDDPPIA